MPPHHPHHQPVAIAKRDPQAGVIPISAVADRSGGLPRGFSGSNATRQAGQRLKAVIRRLPPGLTEQEFINALGEQWKTGKGKVTWMSYRPGKVSRDNAKSSRPARCYIQVSDPAHLNTLNQFLPKLAFADSKISQNDSALVGPPIIEYAAYGRVPNSKRRNDARQGTIDQDPEFIDFLQSLTAPIQKPKALDATEVSKDAPVTVTPLIQHLRDKKAAKEKNAAAKTTKQDAKQDDGKPENKRPGASKEAANTKDGKNASPAKTPTKAARDVRSPQRHDRTNASPRAQAAVPAKPTTPQANNATAANRPRDTPSPSTAAARMLQRDLPGFQGGRGGRATSRGRGGRSPEIRKATLNSTPLSTTNPTASASAAAPSTATPPTGPARPMQKPAPNTGPNSPPTQISTASTTPQRPTNTPTAPSRNLPINANRPSPKQAPTADPTATRAFLKHANASQGITEPLLHKAMSTFGPYTNLTIDKRKGFAYVDFNEPAGLQAAMAASPVPVGQGSVTVLERKERNEQPHVVRKPEGVPAGPAAAINGPAAGPSPGRGGRGVGGFRGRGGPRGGRGAVAGGRGGGGRGGAAAAAAQVQTQTQGNGQGAGDAGAANGAVGAA